ncbi:MAG: uracil-DNA glycosylase [Planctomycetes bacterium]|nr:uracil-DNA glycosylase [Planctomycetota bacterium]MBU4398615.1 uracil-DNA glycosylase [Planctomycetota bacterium]
MIQRLEGLEGAGVTHVPKGRKLPDTPPVAQPHSVVPQVGTAEGGCATRESPTDQRAAALAEVEREVSACTRCTELARARTQTVFGVGNPCARLVFCGEAPGADEDRIGQPFVGRAGQLLTDIIVKGMKMRREDVYILNILRCRPPGNRNPLPAEAAACREFLDRQLEIIQPDYICCLGSVAAQNLLDTTESIGRLRGCVHDYRGIPVVCTYHPAYLLRNPSVKRSVWEDIQMLMAEMERKSGRRRAEDGVVPVKD